MSDLHMRQLARDALLSPSEMSDRSIDGRCALVAKLESVCASERRRGLANDWTYNHARHCRILRALERERAELHAMIKKTVRRFDPAYA